MTVCPTCDDSFDSERGMRIHHGHTHDESLALEKAECGICGKEYEHYPSNGTKGLYCGDCNGKWNRKETVKSKCPECQKVREFKPYQYRQRKTNYCRSCLPRDAEDNPAWKGGKEEVECVVCGDIRKVTPALLDYQNEFTCSYNCHSERCKEKYRGESNPNWKGGQVDYYGDDWYSSRRKVRKRDGNICQVCGVGEDELGFKPHVHHIDPVRNFDNPNNAHEMDNMIQLCPVCHNKAEAGKIDVPEVV